MSLMVKVTSLLAGDTTVHGTVKTVAAVDRRGTEYSVVFTQLDGSVVKKKFRRQEELELI